MLHDEYQNCFVFATEGCTFVLCYCTLEVCDIDFMIRIGCGEAHFLLESFRVKYRVQRYQVAADKRVGKNGN